jgi:hypothetical protein
LSDVGISSPLHGIAEEVVNKKDGNQTGDEADQGEKSFNRPNIIRNVRCTVRFYCLVQTRRDKWRAGVVDAAGMEHFLRHVLKERHGDKRSQDRAHGPDKAERVHVGPRVPSGPDVQHLDVAARVEGASADTPHKGDAVHAEQGGGVGQQAGAHGCEDLAEGEGQVAKPGEKRKPYSSSYLIYSRQGKSKLDLSGVDEEKLGLKISSTIPRRRKIEDQNQPIFNPCFSFYADYRTVML